MILSGFQLSQAQAGLYLEPFVTSIIQGNLRNSDPTLTTTLRDGEASGVQYGGRLGWAFANGALTLGGEYETGTLEREWDETTLTDGEMTTKNTGGFFRMGFNNFAFYATYIFDAEHDLDFNKQVFTGDGFKLGFAVALFRHVQLLFEYESIEYDEVENNSVVGDAYNESSLISAGLSFPF